MSTVERDATAIPTGTWNLDSVHSSIGFAVKYSGAGTFRGTFDQFDATLVDGRLEGVVRVASVRVDDPQLAGHLQSTDFFDAERSPELRFAADSLERNGDEVAIEGELTLRGVTKPVTISGTIVGPTPHYDGAQRIAFDVETQVDRRQFGINWNMDLPTGDPALGNDVTITANLALVRA